MSAAAEATSPPSIRVAKGASWAFTQGLVSSIAILAYYAFATRILSVTEIGVLVALSMIALLFVEIGALALPSAATKYIAENIGKGRLDVAKGIFQGVSKYGLVSSVVLALICFGASTFISRFVLGTEAYQILFSILALDIFAMLFTRYLAGSLYGLGKLREASLAYIALRMVRVGGAISFLLLGYGLMGVVIGWVIGDFVGLGLMSLFVSKPFKVKPVAFPSRELLRYSIPLYATEMLAYFSLYIERYLILGLGEFSILAIFTMAIAASNIPMLASRSIGLALFPQLSEMYGRRGVDTLKKAALKASRYVCFIFVPCAVGLAAIAYPDILLFVGSQYLDAALPLAIISGAAALVCMETIVYNLMLSLGRTRILLEAGVFAILVDVALFILLLPPLGIIGAAFAKAGLIVVLFVYPSIRLRKFFELRFDKGAYGKAWVASLVMMTVLIAIQALWMTPWLLPLYVVVGGGVYLAVLRILRAVNAEDFALVRQFLPRRLSGKSLNAIAKILGVREEVTK
ncbi:MAG: oligosaccharide flippase family protein [Candidatus Bathyarchaeota archaeon]